MHASSFRKLAKMHTLKVQVKNRTRKRGQTLRKMAMLRAYSTRLRPTQTALFAKYPHDDTLCNAFACSEWVRLKGTAKEPQYLVGVLYDDGRARYVCYALAAQDKNNPPDEIKNVCTFVPSTLFKDTEGFFVIFQSAASGECIKPEQV